LRSIRWLSVCVLSCVLAWGCEDPGPGTEKPPEQSGECSNAGDCYKKKCPQADALGYEKCVLKLLSSGSSSPEYAMCSAGACKEVASSEMGDGLVEVTYPDSTNIKAAKDSVKWLRLYIFPDTDHAGKAITCERLKGMAESDPASLMSLELGRYFPPPDFDQPVTSQVLRSGDSLDLAYVNTHLVVPAGDNRVFVVQGFCDPATGSPVASTPAKWWACKEGVTTKVGEKSTNVTIELPVQNEDRCL